MSIDKITKIQLTI